MQYSWLMTFTQQISTLTAIILRFSTQMKMDMQPIAVYALVFIMKFANELQINCLARLDLACESLLHPELAIWILCITGNMSLKSRGLHALFQQRLLNSKDTLMEHGSELVYFPLRIKKWKIQQRIFRGVFILKVIRWFIAGLRMVLLFITIMRGKKTKIGHGG